MCGRIHWTHLKAICLKRGRNGTSMQSWQCGSQSERQLPVSQGKTEAGLMSAAPRGRGTATRGINAPGQNSGQKESPLCGKDNSGGLAQGYNPCQGIPPVLPARLQGVGLAAADPTCAPRAARKMSAATPPGHRS